MRWMAGLSIAVCTAACGFSAPNGAAISGGDDGGDGSAAIDATPPPLDALFGVDSSVDAPPDSPPAPGCIKNGVEAWKSYGLFGSNSPGVLAANATYRVLVMPPRFPIKYGNAGNHCASLELKRASDGATVRCRYRGGADVSSTFGNLEQYAKGLEYLFDGCTVGNACPTPSGQVVTLAANERIEMDPTGQVRIRIDNGDSSLGTTWVDVEVERCDPDADSD